MSPLVDGSDTTIADLGAEAVISRLRGYGPLVDVLGTYSDGELRLEEGTPAEIVDEPKAEHFPVYVLTTIDADEFASRLSGEFRYQLDLYVWPRDALDGARPFGVDGIRQIDAIAKSLLGKGKGWRYQGVHFSSSDFDLAAQDTPPDGPYVRRRRGTIRAGG